MEENFDSQKLEKKVDDILEIVQFIKDNSASKDDIKDMATKDDIKDMATKDDIKDMATKDDIARLEAKMDEGFASIRTELVGINLELEEIKKDLRKLESRTQIDDDVMIVDNLKLSKRVKKLEKQVRQLELAHN